MSVSGLLTLKQIFIWTVCRSATK